MKNQNKLKKKKSIFIVISPPRCGSTLLGKSLSFAPIMKHYFHEPCFNLKYKNKNKLAVFDSILNFKDENVVVKEMAQWANISEAYKELFAMTKNPVLFLIRNPFIAAESKIRRAILTYDKREKTPLKNFLKSYFGNVHDNSTQNELLDLFAKGKGFSSWVKLVNHILKERDYKYVGKIIETDTIFSLFDLGWESLEKQIDYCKKKQIDYKIIDNTDLLLFPETIAKSICNDLKIDYSPNMINWGSKTEELQTSGQGKNYQVIWYDTLKKSNRILEPSEIPLPLDNFPDKIKYYLLETALPIYVRCSNDKMRIRLTSKISIDEKKVTIPLNKLAIKRLKEVGTISCDNYLDELKGKKIFKEKEEFKELIFDIDEKDSDGVVMPMIDMDPVFCSIRNEKLLYNLAFLGKNPSYSTIFNSIKEMGSEEKIDVLDYNGKQIGINKKRSEIHRGGLWHWAVHVWIVNSKNQFLIQKRSKNVETSSGYWTISVSGHVKSGQRILNAAKEELNEELGINVKETELEFFSEYKKSKYHPETDITDNEFNHIYILKKDVESDCFNLDSNEVEQVRFVCSKELKKMIKNKSINFRPDNPKYHELLFDFFENS
ncbi:MAG: NUDIX hydrolase [Nanobdellota archaeon]